MKPFRFGVNVGPSRSRAEWAEKARKLEELGYDALTVPDHLADLFAPMPALVGAAEATKTLRVGTNVLNNDFRHPVMVAREAATVDLLTEGRLQLGLGAGHMKYEYDQAGLTFDTGGTRVERLAEAVIIIKGLLSGEEVTFAGRHYRVTRHTVHPLPVRRPHPPIVVSGNGRRLLTLAAREADIVGLSGITFRRGGTAPDIAGWKEAGVTERVQLIKEISGDRFAQIELNVLAQQVLVTDDRPGQPKSWQAVGASSVPTSSSRALTCSSAAWTSWRKTFRSAGSVGVSLTIRFSNPMSARSLPSLPVSPVDKCLTNTNQTIHEQGEAP